MYKRYFLGIDPSLNSTGFVVIDSDGKVVHQSVVTKQTKEIKHDDKYFELNQKLILQKFELRKIVKKYKPIFCCIEDISWASKFTIVQQSAILFGLLATFYKYSDSRMFCVSPQSVKSYVIENRKGTTSGSRKDLVILNIYKTYGLEFTDNNLADAFILASMAQIAYRIVDKKPIDGAFKRQADLIRKMKKFKELCKRNMY